MLESYSGRDVFKTQSKIERFPKIVNSWKQNAKRSILDVWLGSENASDRIGGWYELKKHFRGFW